MKIFFTRSLLKFYILSLNIFPLIQKGGLVVCILAIAFSQIEAKAENAKLGNTEKTAQQETKKSPVTEWKNPRLVYTLDVLTDAEKGENFYKNIPMYFGKPYPLAISPDGKKVASGGVNTIRLWDLQTGNEIGEPLFSAQGVKPLGISWISFSSDGKILNVFSTGNEILESSNSNNIEPTANNSSQSSNSISRIGGIDNWFRQDQVSVGISFKSQSSSSRKMSFSKPIEEVWDLLTRTRISSLPASDENKRLLMLAYIQSITDKTNKSVSERLSKEIQQMIESQHDGEIYSIVFSSDGKILITSGKDGKIRIWRDD